MTEPCVSVSESLNSVPKKTGLIPRGFLWHRVDRSLPPSEVLGRVEPKIPVSSEHDQCGPESEELTRIQVHISVFIPTFPSNLNVKLEPFSMLSVQRGAWNIAPIFCDESP
jgi:hypothetical protein